jgi:hypothetical protein
MSEGGLGGIPLQGLEKRKFPRIEVETPVKFAVVIPTHEEGVTADISQGGMCLNTRRAMAQGTVLRLDFDLPGNPPVHVEALGQVMWQRTNPDGSFATGIKFVT